jgi:hypothetical protein
MKTFEQGARVIRTETGEKGTVREQFIDGYVSLDFDDGRPAELVATSLKELESDKPAD